MYQVRKRNGDSVIFDLSKIQTALTRSFESCNRNYQDVIVEKLAMKAVARAEQKIKDNLLSVEDIQDAVESVLMSYGYEDVAKAYILYRKQHEKARNAQETVLDYKKTIEGYTNASDWRVKENASIDYSLGGLILNNSGTITANYWLSEIYDEEIANAHRNCDIHLHDLSMLSGYCFTGDTVVKTLDGKNRTFEQLVSDGVDKIWLYAYDHETQSIVPAIGENPRVTRYVNEIAEITLASGKKIRCTKDHPIMLRDGTYLSADKLKPNMSVMPLNISESGKYVQINKYWSTGSSDTKRNYVHRWVVESIIGRKLDDNEVIHHINEDKHDNTPENLCVMSDADHRAYEVRKTMQTDVWKNNNGIRLTEYNKSESKRKSVSEFSKNRVRDEQGKFTKFKYDEEKDTKQEAYNHRVRKVRIVKLETDIPVYDLTVPKYHNFAVDGSIFVHNCAGWSLKTLIKEGFGGVPKKMSCRPAKHLSTLCGQMVNYLGTMSLEWAGAQAFNSVDTLLAPFVKVEDLSYKEVKQCIQSLVNNLNISSRWGSQPVFSNFTFDWTVPDDLAELNCIVGGKEVDFKYKDCKREMDMINRAFLEVMIEGDADGKSFAYPIPTYSITKDFDWDTESINNKLLFEMTAKYGIPYFSNYINSDMEPSDVRSMCCRLRLSLKELRKKNGGYFGSGDNTGSIQVCTINLPRLAYKSKTADEFYANLEHLMDICARATDIKRRVLTQHLEHGLYPYTKRYLKSFDDHFSTIGIIGMNEACLNASWIRDNIASDAGYEFAKDVLDFMLNKLPDYQEKYGCLFNLEATPGESTTYRFASHDKKDFPDIITAGDSTDGAPYYTNSSHLPVGYTDDIFTALDHQDDLQTKYTSGTVFHAFLGEKLPNWESAMMLTKKIAENYKLPYFTFSPTYSICPDHGYIRGEEWTCPECGKKTEVYSRVTGYYRAVQNFNDGKAHEFKDRKEYKVGDLSAENDTCESCSTGYTELPEQIIEEDTETAVRKILAPTRKPMLFTTATCPNCKMAKKFISDAGFECDILLAEENAELVNLYKVSQAPTLIVFNDGEPQTISNVSNIRKYLDSVNK